jgi:hypothetical protein
VSRFFVGQPVRINCPMSQQHGKQTTVTALEMATPAFTGIEVDIPLRVPFDASLLAHVILASYPRCVFEAHELEPILPEGAAPSEFANLRDLLDSLEQVRA